MSLASPSSQSASSTHSSSAGSPTNVCRTPPEDMVDPQELERRLRAVRDRTPLTADCVDKIKADTQRYYEELIALGGRPTGPIQHYPSCKTTMAVGMNHYRDEYETIESIFEVDKRRESSHWTKERNKWGEQLFRWQKFKESQRIQHQYGRSELELELENTDAALVEVLSKLNDWQECEVIRERKVYHAEADYEECQQGHAANQNAIVAVTSADATSEIQEPHGGWMYYMGGVQKELEDLQKELMWVKSQWTEVIAEACSSIAAAPKLQEELEAKFQTQANAIYRCLQQTGAKPSRAVQSPDIDAEFPQRIQHWNSEVSTFTSELWDWKIFMSWRRDVKESGNMDQEGRKLLSQGDSCSELFEDLVKYQQQKLDRAASWVNCWRHQARQYMEARRRTLRRNRLGWLFYEEVDYDYDNNDGDDDDDAMEDPEAQQAELFALHAEEKVSVAAKRLEQSKQRLRAILAESGPTSTAKHPPIQRLPTPPKSQSPESLPGSRRSSKVREPTGKGYRRSKKERARKGKAGMANINIEQHALPPFSLGSNHLTEYDDELEMSDHEEEPNQADSEDTVMSDVEDPPNYSPSSPPESQPRPTTNTNHRKLPSPNSQTPTSRKTRSSTKLDQVSSGKILKKSSENKPLRKTKAFTEQQTTALLDAASTSYPSTGPTSLGRNEPESYPKPTTDTAHKKLPSPSSQTPTSRKTRSSTKLDQAPYGEILQNPSKNKPQNETKDFTEQQTTALLQAVSTSCPSAGPTSLGRDVPESYPKSTADTDHRESPAPSYDTPTSSCPSTAPTSLGRDEPESYPRPAANNDYRELSPPSSQTPTSNCPSTGSTSLGSNLPESYPNPTADTDHRELPPPNSQTPISRKTRIDQIPSGKILKNQSKDKPSKKDKVFTEQQRTPLLNAASASRSSTCPIQPRRSERLKEKAAAAKGRVCR